MALYVVFDGVQIYAPIVDINRLDFYTFSAFLFDFCEKMRFCVAFALGFAPLWAPAMFFRALLGSCNKKPCIIFAPAVH